MQDGSGTVWLGTEGGALYFDGTAWGIYDESNGLGNNDVSDIMEDAWGDLWFSSIDGEFLTRYNGHISEYVRTYGFDQCLVTSLIEDQNRNIWLTSAFGILKYNRAEMITIQLPPEFPDDIIYCSEMDANGNLWFGTFYNGIYFYSTE
jgi:ligand-binding sensor domain-containing protein